MANIGYVGLGVMGGQMAVRLLEKGHTVTGYNRTRSKAQWLVDKGLNSFELVIGGDGPSRKSLEEQVQSLGVAKYCRFLGALNREQVRERMQDCDVFVLPSVQARDGGMDNLPTVLMEAMAMQLPVVSTRTAGIPEMVVDGQTGLLVPERNPAALATAVRALLSDPARARQMAIAGRSYAERRFDRRITTKALLRLFDAALTVRGSAAVSRRAEAVKKPTNKSL